MNSYQKSELSETSEREIVTNLIAFGIKSNVNGEKESQNVPNVHTK